MRLGPENFCFAARDDWSVVIDVGVGGAPTFAPWIRQETDAFIVLCDPTPKHLPALRAWASAHERMVLVEAAVAREDGQIAFFESASEESGSTDETHINRAMPGRMVEVDAITLSSLLNRASEYGPVVLVKLDLEGAEFGIFSDIERVTEAVEAVPQWFVEFHPAPQTEHSLASILQIRELFRSVRYREFSRNGIDYLFWRS